MIAFASVDLPEPFGPISAWTWPCCTSRSRPLRISFSPARTCRLRISRCDIGLLESLRGSALDDGQRDGSLGDGGLHGVAAARELDELRERCLLERLDHPAVDSHPQQLGRARGAMVVLV